MCACVRVCVCVCTPVCGQRGRKMCRAVTKTRIENDMLDSSVPRVSLKGHYDRIGRFQRCVLPLISPDRLW